MSFPHILCYINAPVRKVLNREQHFFEVAWIEKPMISIEKIKQVHLDVIQNNHTHACEND